MIPPARLYFRKLSIPDDCKQLGNSKHRTVKQTGFSRYENRHFTFDSLLWGDADLIILFILVVAHTKSNSVKGFLRYQ